MNQTERLKEIIAQMVITSSYWGYLFSRVRRVPCSNLESIMGVKPERDGTISLMYDVEKMENTEDDVIKLVVEHEGFHVLNKHIPRLIRIIATEFDNTVGNIKARVWNYAADMAVHGQMEMPKEVMVDKKPFHPIFPENYNLPPRNMSEFYYNRLIQDQKAVEGMCGLGDGEGDGKKKGKGQGQQSKGGFIGDHKCWKDGTEGVADLHAIARKIENYIADIVRESLKNFSNKRGYLPGNVSDLIDAVLKPPQIPYYSIIKKLVKASRISKMKRCPTRINRKRTYMFTLGQHDFPQLSPFPGRTRDFSFNIGIVLDTSGSMSKDDIMEGLSGVKHIIEKDRHCRTTIIENDTQIQMEYEVKKIKDIHFNVHGRGGTVLLPALERCKELQTDVNLVFTDGFCDNVNGVPRKFLPKKLIYVITNNGAADKVNRTGFVVRLPV